MFTRKKAVTHVADCTMVVLSRVADALTTLSGFPVIIESVEVDTSSSFFGSLLAPLNIERIGCEVKGTMRTWSSTEPQEFRATMYLMNDGNDPEAPGWQIALSGMDITIQRNAGPTRSSTYYHASWNETPGMVAEIRVIRQRNLLESGQSDSGNFGLRRAA